MTTELTIGAVNPGYGGLPIGVAAALGGASLAWHAHPGKPFDYAGRMIMRYHHPRTGAYTSIDTPPMVDVLTINGFSDWLITGGALIGAGYKPPLVIVEVSATRAKARPICEYLNARGYRAAWRVVRAYDVGAPHVRYRAYVIAARTDCERRRRVNTAYLDADRCTGALWPTPEVDDTLLVETAYQWALDDLAVGPDKGRTLALEHWAKVTGEPYPYPLYTTPTPDTQGSATLAFIEWMMGLPVGYVSTPGLPLTRAERMRLLQTGTVPLQAAHAVAVGLKQMGDQ